MEKIVLQIRFLLKIKKKIFFVEIMPVLKIFGENIYFLKLFFSKNKNVGGQFLCILPVIFYCNREHKVA